MGSAGFQEERVDRLHNIEKRLRAIESTVRDCRNATSRLLRNREKEAGRQLGCMNEGGDVEWEADRFESFLLSLSLSEAMRWLAKTDSPSEATVRGGGVGTPPAGQPPSGPAPPQSR